MLSLQYKYSITCAIYICTFAHAHLVAFAMHSAHSKRFHFLGYHNKGISLPPKYWLIGFAILTNLNFLTSIHCVQNVFAKMFAVLEAAVIHCLGSELLDLPTLRWTEAPPDRGNEWQKDIDIATTSGTKEQKDIEKEQKYQRTLKKQPLINLKRNCKFSHPLISQKWTENAKCIIGNQ